MKMRSKTALLAAAGAAVLALSASNANAVTFWDTGITLQPGESYSFHEINLTYTALWDWESFHFQTPGTIHTTIDVMGSMHLLEAEWSHASVQSSVPFTSDIWLLDPVDPINDIHVFTDVNTPSAIPADPTLPYEMAWWHTAITQEWYDFQAQFSFWEPVTFDQWISFHDHFEYIDITGFWLTVTNDGTEPVIFDFHGEWIPTPGALPLLAMGALCVTRRRR